MVPAVKLVLRVEFVPMVHANCPVSKASPIATELVLTFNQTASTVANAKMVVRLAMSAPQAYAN